MSENLILRPVGGWLILQLTGGLVMAAVLVLAVWLPGGRDHVGSELIFAAGFFAMAAGLHVLWFRSGAPLAIVANPTHLAILHRDRQRTYVPWDAVLSAAHMTAVLGMRWRIDASGERITLRDIGVDSDRWALLWVRVATEVSQRGGSVRVDALSRALIEEKT